MSNNNITIIMSEQEAIRYYANKIIEDSLSDCVESNYRMCIDNYNNKKFIKQHQNQILEEIRRDEKVLDVLVDEHNIYDIVFYADYCPNYYEEYDLSIERQRGILQGFINYLIDVRLKNDNKDTFNTTTQKLINDFIMINKFVVLFTAQEKEFANNMLKESICKTSFFSKYLDKYKVVVNNQNMLELVTELQAKLQKLLEQIRDEQAKNSIKNLTQEDIDIMLKIFNSNKNFPKKYITLGICKTDNKYLAVDNLDKQMYIEEFDTREQAINYLFRYDIEF